MLVVNVTVNTSVIQELARSGNCCVDRHALAFKVAVLTLPTSGWPSRH